MSGTVLFYNKALQHKEGKNMAKISVYIIAYNEEAKIKSAIESVLWADEIIVADSFSTDKTGAIATSLGARVVQIPFSGFGELRNKAIAECANEWIFSLDADERCTPEAKEEILRITNSADFLDVYHVPRKNIFLGRWIKHAWAYPDYRQPQLFRKGMMEYKPDQVHEGFVLKTQKPLGFLKNAIWQFPFQNLEQILVKANRYSTLGLERIIKRKVKPSIGKTFVHAFWGFFKHYFLKCGFLDGWPGFIIAISNAEGGFYKYAKLIEYYRVNNEEKTKTDT